MRSWLAASVIFAVGAGRVEARQTPTLSAHAEGHRLKVGWISAPKTATEWEAFLSFDGGKSVALRVTPHLPISTREFVFELPRLASEQAAVVFRFGDGREDRQYLLPAPIAIPRDLSAMLLKGRAADTGARPAPGEESSVGWATSAHVTVVPPAGSGMAAATRLVPASTAISFTRSPGLSLLEHRRGRPTLLDGIRRPRQRRPAATPDILLLSSRLNV